MSAFYLKSEALDMHVNGSILTKTRFRGTTVKVSACTGEAGAGFTGQGDPRFMLTRSARSLARSLTPLPGPLPGPLPDPTP